MRSRPTSGNSVSDVDAKYCADSQMRQSVLLDDVYVPSGNGATSIDIVAEVGACHRLKGLCLAKIGVATCNNSAGIDIANEHTHLC